MTRRAIGIAVLIGLPALAAHAQDAPMVLTPPATIPGATAPVALQPVTPPLPRLRPQMSVRQSLPLDAAPPAPPLATAPTAPPLVASPPPPSVPPVASPPQAPAGEQPIPLPAAMPELLDVPAVDKIDAAAEGPPPAGQGVAAGEQPPVPASPAAPATTLSTPAEGAAGADLAYGAFQRGLYLSAFSLAIPRAEAGDAAAQTLIGLIYEGGYGLPRDYREAANCYQFAAKGGAREAQFAL
ncbi:MAG: hypothetical protein WD036_06490, partial [Bauldia sp.]